MNRIVTVNAGEHVRRNCVVHVPLDTASIETPCAALTDENGSSIPAQVVRGPVPALCFVVARLGRHETRCFTVTAGAIPQGRRVRLSDVSGERVDVTIGGKLFTSYHYARTWARPFLLPLVGPFGDPVTRRYPVEDVEGETRDHPHHKSCWVAWGDVNGTDNWSELEGHGRQVHQRFACVESGPVFCRIVAANHWVDRNGTRILEEQRSLAFYNLPARARMMDLAVTFTASDGPVRFGDTKEGGIVSVRVASSMDARANGVITNSYGGRNEEETWGKRAHWCDYTGLVNGKTVGIAIFDTPGNLRYPTYWHVRNYGLMTANPFGVSHFRPGEGLNGSITLEAGKSLCFRYRILVHAGDAEKACVADRYLDYVAPPKVVIE